MLRHVHLDLAVGCWRFGHQLPHAATPTHHSFLSDVQRAVWSDQNPSFFWVTDGVGAVEFLRGTKESAAIFRHPVGLHAIASPPHSGQDNDDDDDPHGFHDEQHGACVRNTAIACDTVRRDRGRSGGFVNGVTVGFVLLADTFDDPENARIILLSAAGLVILGLLIAAGTVWWWRSSEVEHPALGPLEVMSSRSWWKGDYAARRRRIEDARPEGAELVDPPAAAPSDPLDLKASALASPQEFDDLLEFPPAAAGESVLEGVVGADVEADVDPAIDPAVDAPQVVADTSEPPEPETDKDDTPGGESVATMSRPIDPLLRLHHDA